MWQIWLIIAILFFILEMMGPGFLLFWVGVGALITMIVSIFCDNIVIQIGVFTISSILLLFCTRPLAKKFTKNDNTITNANSIIGKKAIVTKEIRADEDDISRFGVVKVGDNGRVLDFEEKPLVAETSTASIGVYVVRRRQLIELLETCAAEGRTDFVKDILIRYKNVKRINAYSLDSYWRNIGSIDSYFKTNMDFLNPEVRDHFFRTTPGVYTKVEDLPPAKFNGDAVTSNSLIASGCIINGSVENSVLFKKVYVGNNCVIKNSIILNDVHIGDNCYIENCIVESRDTIKANTVHTGEVGNPKIVIEKSFRYTL